MMHVNLDNSGSFTKVSSNGKGNGFLPETVRAWAEQTGNFSEAVRLYTFYHSELSLDEDSARAAAEDSMRINAEVEHEFAAT